MAALGRITTAFIYTNIGIKNSPTLKEILPIHKYISAITFQIIRYQVNESRYTLYKLSNIVIPSILLFLPLFLPLFSALIDAGVAGVLVAGWGG